MPKIKTLQPATSFVRFDGEDGFTIEYAKRLVAKGIAVDAVAPHDVDTKGFEVIDGVAIHRFSYFFPKSLQRLAYHGGVAFNLSKSTLAKFQFPLFMFSFFLKTAWNAKGKDIIHAQWVPSGLISVLIKKLTGKPVVLWVHRMNYGGPFVKSMTRFVLRNCDFVLFNSSYTLNRAKRLSKMKAFAIVPPGVDENLFKPIKKTGIRKKIGVGTKTKMVFAVGRFVEKKGFACLINAMEKVKARDVVCVIAGVGPLEGSLKQLAKEKGLEKKVLFPGWVKNSELPLWMNEADVVVVPSIVDSRGDTETLGIVAIEAIACGSPIIVSNVGGLVDVVKHGFNGFIARQKDSNDLAKKINLILQSNSLNNKMAKNAREHAEQNFSWAKTVEKTIEIYQKVLEKKRN